MIGRNNVHRLAFGAALVAGCHGARPAEMVHIEAGTFQMGCPGGDRRCDVVEGVAPMHAVALSAFDIDRTEVTEEAYRACVDTGGCTAAGCGGDMRRGHPMACVSWDQARAYCIWAHKRLPTEAEWERAARGTDTRAFPWGEDEATCARANFQGCVGGTWKVGQAPAGVSAAGVLDMAGNVAEWVADWMDTEYYRVHPMPADPQGPSAGDQRVHRGGAFDDPAGRADNALHVSSRASAPPSVRLPTLGFRCVRSSAVRLQ